MDDIVQTKHSEDTTLRAPPNYRHYWKWAIALLVVLPLLVLAMTVVLSSRISGTPKESARVVWSASSGEPVPRDFYYLAFPKNADVELVRRDGTPAGVKLSRAFLCAESERESGDRFAIFEDEEELRVRKGDVVFRPNIPNASALIENYRRKLRSWGPDVTDWRSVDLDWEEVPDGAYRVTLQVATTKGRRYYYVYVVSGDTVKPEESMQWNPLMRGFGL